MLLAGLPDRRLAGSEPSHQALRAGHLGLAGQHDEQLPPAGRVPADGAARGEVHRDEVRVGVTDIDTYPTEVGCLAALVERAEAGDVVGLMCHAERQQAYDWIAAHGGTADTPEVLAAKVRAATA